MRFSFVIIIITQILFCCSNPQKETEQSTDSSAIRKDSSDILNSVEKKKNPKNTKENKAVNDKYNGKTESAIRNSPREIVDYYLIFPNPKEFEVKKESETGNEFIARIKSLEPSEMVISTIDTANGYVSIYHTGEEKEIQMALFKSASGSNYIAARFYKKGEECDNEKFIVYEYKDKEWIEVTSKVIPETKMSDFCTAESLPHSEMQKYNISYAPMPKGTVINASIKPICESDPYFAEKQIPVVAYNSAFRRAKCHKAPLSWNKTKATFELSK